MYLSHTTCCKLVCRETHGTKMPGHNSAVLGDELSHYKKSSNLKRLHLKSLQLINPCIFVAVLQYILKSSHNGWTLSIIDCNSGFKLSLGQQCSITDSTCWYFSRQPGEEEHLHSRIEFTCSKPD